MPDRRPWAQELLLSGRAAFGPTVDDRARVFQLLVTRLGAFALASEGFAPAHQAHERMAAQRSVDVQLATTN